MTAVDFGRSHCPAPRELELKLELTPDELQQLNTSAALIPLTVGEPTTKTLRSIYFDTPDQRLREADVSLRVRSDGTSWIQTIKYGTRISAGISHPVEIETALKYPEPYLNGITERELRRKIKRLTKDTVLEPVFEVVVKRIERRLHTEKGELELALDEGTVRAGERETPLCEAELELKSGAPECLLTVADEMFAGSPLRFSEKSKADTGYDLVNGRKPGCGFPVRAQLVELAEDNTCAAALLLFVRSAHQQIVANRFVVLNSDDPEGPHQLRVGLRRLRTALRIFRPLLDAAPVRELEALAKELSGAIGELRDADVFLDGIYAPAAHQLKGHTGLPVLKCALRAHRSAKQDRARAALLGERWSRLQLYLALCPLVIEAQAPLQEAVSAYAGKALRKSWRGVAKRGVNFASLTEEERHDMRLALKRHRYAIEFFQSLYRPNDICGYVKQLKQSQDVFGYINDAANARQIEAIADRLDSKECQRVAGYVIGWHAARAQARWATAQECWHQLQRSRRFWR